MFFCSILYPGFFFGMAICGREREGESPACPGFPLLFWNGGDWRPAKRAGDLCSSGVGGDWRPAKRAGDLCLERRDIQLGEDHLGVSLFNYQTNLAGEEGGLEHIMDGFACLFAVDKEGKGILPRLNAEGIRLARWCQQVRRLARGQLHPIAAPVITPECVFPCIVGCDIEEIV